MGPLPGMIPFASRFPDLAGRETRVVSLLQPGPGLRRGNYGFLELYCNDPACDCRRVLLEVIEQAQPQAILATINFGWESVEFYTRWLHGDAQGARETKEASLDPLNAQSDLAPHILRLFRELLMPDAAYVARLRRHYDLVKRGPARTRPDRR